MSPTTVTSRSGTSRASLAERAVARIVGEERVEAALDLRAGQQSLVGSGHDVDRRHLPGGERGDHDDLARRAGDEPVVEPAGEGVPALFELAVLRAVLETCREVG